MLIESVEQYEEILEKKLAELNANPTRELVEAFEHSLCFYSDIYKDEYGFRPTVSGYRDRYCAEAKEYFMDYWEHL